jgi:hypothetical protein
MLSGEVLRIPGAAREDLEITACLALAALVVAGALVFGRWNPLA